MTDAPLIPPDAQCREFIFEQMGFVRISAELAQRYCELGDDVGLKYQLRRLIAHVRAATQTFKEIAPASMEDKEAA